MQGAAQAAPPRAAANSRHFSTKYVNQQGLAGSTTNLHPAGRKHPSLACSAWRVGTRMLTNDPPEGIFAIYYEYLTSKTRQSTLRLRD